MVRFNHTILKANVNKDGKTKILLRVYYKRVRYFPVQMHNQHIYVTPKQFKRLSPEVMKFLSEELIRVKTILSKIEFTWSEFERLYLGGDGLHDALDVKINELKEQERWSTMIGYIYAKRTFEDIKLSKINESYLVRYKRFPCYLKYLRHICSRSGHGINLTVSERPKLKIPLGINDLRKIVLFNSELRGLQRARDFFLLSYFGGGMNTKDWYFLKRSEIHGDVIYKMRSKTGVPIIVTINPEMRKIIERYDTGQDYVFGVRDGDDREKYKGYKTWFGNYRRDLRKLQSRLGIETKITPYVARYTHAAILRSRGVSLEDAQESMSHRDMSSTRVYWGMMGMDKRRELQRLLRV